jgi:hypothetical protein
MLTAVDLKQVALKNKEQTYSMRIFLNLPHTHHVVVNKHRYIMTVLLTTLSLCGSSYFVLHTVTTTYTHCHSKLEKNSTISCLHPRGISAAVAITVAAAVVAAAAATVAAAATAAATAAAAGVCNCYCYCCCCCVRCCRCQ